MKSLIDVSLYACFYAINFAHRLLRVVLPYGISRDVIQTIPWGSPSPYPARSLHLGRTFRKSVSIYRRSTSGVCLKFMGCL